MRNYTAIWSGQQLPLIRLETQRLIKVNLRRGATHERTPTSAQILIETKVPRTHLLKLLKYVPWFAGDKGIRTAMKSVVHNIIYFRTKIIEKRAVGKSWKT